MTLRFASSLVAAVAVTLLSLAGATTAHAATDVSDAAAALRGGETVFVDPSAENTLSSAEVGQLTAQANATGIPMFIAVLPESAAGGGTADDVLRDLNSQVGLGGVYAVIVGDQFRAGSTSGSVSDLATQAFRAERANGAAAVLSEFVALTDARLGSASSSSTAGESSGAGSLVLLLVLIVGGAVVVIVLVRRQRRVAAQQLAAVRTTVDRDVTEYGERLAAFDVHDPAMDESARADVQRALDDYDRARFSVATMRRAQDAESVTAALEDGRFALACAQARMTGQALPERRPPCFVDPRHGPSVADVLWTPPGLSLRDVPMCAACRTTVETGGTPASFDVETTDGQRRPYYQAGPEHGAYAQGYYSPFAGVMGAVLMGTVISSMWSMPGITSTSGLDSAGMGGGGGDWGGFGGGDFGGGDFGGGDF